MKESIVEDNPKIKAEQIGVLVKQSLTNSFIVERRIKHFRQTSFQWVLIAPDQTLLVVLIAREQGSHDFHHALHTLGRKHLHQEEKVSLDESHVAIVGFLEHSRKLLIFFRMVIVPTPKGKDIQFVSCYLGLFLLAILHCRHKGLRWSDGMVSAVALPSLA